MAANTEALDDGKYVTHSSLSVVASRATVIAQDVTATSVLSTAALTVQGTATLNGGGVFSSVSVVNGTSVNTLVANSTISAVGTTSLGVLVVNSTISAVGATSLGVGTLNSTLSAGGAVTFQSTAQVRSALTGIGWVYGGVFISSATTAQSGATSKISQQGQLYFSVLSLTSNGGEFGFRSGNTVYRFASVDVG